MAVGCNHQLWSLLHGMGGLKICGKEPLVQQDREHCSTSSPATGQMQMSQSPELVHEFS